MSAEIGMQTSRRYTDRVLLITNPGVHEYDLRDDRFTIISPPEVGEPDGDTIMHLVQDEEVIAELHNCCDAA